MGNGDLGAAQAESIGLMRPAHVASLFQLPAPQWSCSFMQHASGCRWSQASLRGRDQTLNFHCPPEDWKPAQGSLPAFLLGSGSKANLKYTFEVKSKKDCCSPCVKVWGHASLLITDILVFPNSLRGKSRKVCLRFFQLSSLMPVGNVCV